MTVRLSDEPGGKKNVPGYFVWGTVPLGMALVRPVPFEILYALAELDILLLEIFVD